MVTDAKVQTALLPENCAGEAHERAELTPWEVSAHLSRWWQRAAGRGSMRERLRTGFNRPWSVQAYDGDGRAVPQNYSSRSRACSEAGGCVGVFDDEFTRTVPRRSVTGLMNPTIAGIFSDGRGAEAWCSRRR
jgi:hypothetical protein